MMPSYKQATEALMGTVDKYLMSKALVLAS